MPNSRVTIWLDAKTLGLVKTQVSPRGPYRSISEYTRRAIEYYAKRQGYETVVAGDEVRITLSPPLAEIIDFVAAYMGQTPEEACKTLLFEAVKSTDFSAIRERYQAVKEDKVRVAYTKKREVLEKIHSQ